MMTKPYRRASEERELLEHKYCNNCLLDISNNPKPCKIWIGFLLNGKKEDPAWIHNEAGELICTSFQDKNSPTITVEVTSEL